MAAQLSRRLLLTPKSGHAMGDRLRFAAFYWNDDDEVAIMRVSHRQDQRFAIRRP